MDAEVGFSFEYLSKYYGSMQPLADALKSGTIRGIVNLVGCNNPRVTYEKAIIDVADVLLKNNILILTNGCASFPLLKMGYCQTSELAYSKCGDSLRKFLEKDNMPPVMHVGECIDNTRSSAIFGAIAALHGKDLKDMPYAFSSPEWSNEKGINAALGFRLHGLNSYHCVEAPIHGSPKTVEFLKESTRKTLGSVMYVDVDPKSLGEKIVEDIKEKRRKLSWVE